MNPLPPEWHIDRLKDVSLINVASLPANTDPDYEFDYLEISNVNYHGVIDQKAIERLRFEDAPTRARRCVERNCTVISSVRPNLQAVAFMSDGRDHLVCSTGFNVVQPIEAKLLPKFAYYALISEGARQYFEASATGVGYPAVGDKAFNSLGVPLPPLLEQDRIAAYLDASCAAIDAAVAAKRRQIETVHSIRTSVITQTVTKGLNGDVPRRESLVAWFGLIPRHWRSGHLKRFATRIQTGVTPPTDKPEYCDDGTIPWFAPGSYDGDIELHDPRKLMNEVARRDGALRMFPSGTVFLIGIGATIGKVGLITEPASCNQQIIGIVSNHRMLPRFLAYQLKIYEAVIPGVAIATTLPIFDQVKTEYLPVLAPPREEQQAICDYLDEKLVDMKHTVASIQGQIDVLTSYRKSLVHECVTGQRRVSEEDLKRVRAHG